MMGYGTWGVDEDPSALKFLKSSCQSRLGKAKTRYFYSGHLGQLGNLGHSGHMGHWGHSGHSGHLGHPVNIFNIATEELTN